VCNSEQACTACSPSTVVCTAGALHASFRRVGSRYTQADPASHAEGVAMTPSTSEHATNSPVLLEQVETMPRQAADSRAAHDPTIRKRSAPTPMLEKAEVRRRGFLRCVAFSRVHPHFISWRAQDSVAAAAAMLTATSCKQALLMDHIVVAKKMPSLNPFLNARSVPLLDFARNKAADFIGVVFHGLD
jgi:hypothetical protein